MFQFSPTYCFIIIFVENKWDWGRFSVFVKAASEMYDFADFDDFDDSADSVDFADSSDFADSADSSDLANSADSADLADALTPGQKKKCKIVLFFGLNL